MIKEYLTQKGLVEKVLTIDEILSIPQENQEINIMMGQTFDSGQPIDMMKYALFIMELEDIMDTRGSKVSSTWLIADHFMTNINEDKAVKEALEQAEARVNYLKLLNKIYGGNIGFVFSSNLSKTSEYLKNLEELKKEVNEDSRFREKVFEAVPLDRRSNPNSINYPLEELAVIQTLKTDIKIGPKYEIKYDNPAREFSPMIGFKKYSAIYLTNCFPLGSPQIEPKLREEIETFGVLPYKKDSKGLAQYRIDPINDNEKKVNALIRSTNDPRALNNLLIISELAKRRLEGKIFSTSLSINNKLSLKEKKEFVLEGYKKIYNSLKNY